MSVTFLSCQVSAVENARRMAEHNLQSTEAYPTLQNEFLACPVEEIRPYCQAAMVGLVGLGALVAGTTSGLVGGCIALTAVIPWAIARSYNAKIERLVTLFEGEVNTNLKFIYEQVNLLFKNALMQKSENLKTQWNNSQTVQLSATNEDSAEQVIQQQFKEISEQYDKTAIFTLVHANQNVNVKYSDLKRYAITIASILPKAEEDIFKHIVYGTRWAQELRTTCKYFTQEAEPKTKWEDFILNDGQQELDRAAIPPKYQTARRFSYSIEGENIVKIIFLKSYLPEGD